MLQRRQASASKSRLYLSLGLVAVVVALTIQARPASSRSADQLPDGQIGGMVADDAGRAVPGLTADLFTAQPNGGRDTYLRSVETKPDGTYRFDADDGCYVVVLIAPPGDRFVRTGRYHQAPVCIRDGRAERTVDGVLRSATATIGGQVRTTAGGPVTDLGVDVFLAPEGDRPGGYVTSTSTDGSGRYTVAVPVAGCFRLLVHPGRGAAVLHATDVEPVETCVGDGDHLDGLDIELTAVPGVRIEGLIAYEDGTAAPELVADLFLAAGDGSRGSYLRSTTAGLGGRYHFDVPPACYVVVLIAPPGERFVDGGRYRQIDSCVEAGQPRPAAGGTLEGSGRPSALTGVELELLRLTNELRADPSGPLARRSPLPDCVEESFYAISVDPTSGHPEPAAPLVVSEAVSIEMARAWAIDMYEREDFVHRPSAAQQEIYGRLGIAASAWGENIAWFAGYGPEHTARVHFEGWRESDTGHYCSLITSRFTHVGVGELRVGDESWAVQNFFAPHPSPAGRWPSQAAS